MKKWMIGLCALATVACGGVNKNTVSYQMSKYDTALYYVVPGNGVTKQDAKAHALQVMQQELATHTPQAAGQQVITDVFSNAKVEKVWRDKQSDSKHYYALAVLPREKANAVLVPLLNKADAQLAGLSTQFAMPADPLADLKVAYKMQPIVDERAALGDLYQFLQADRSSYMPQTFAPYKNIFKEKMAAVRVGVEATGVENVQMATHVVDALNKMGLGVVQADEADKVLLVKVVTELDNYSSKKVDGLVWCSSSATVSLVDMQSGTTFARFNVHERAGTSRLSDSVRLSIKGLGAQAATQITTRLENYLKTK